MKKFMVVALLAVVAAATSFAGDGFAYGVWFNSPKETTNTSVSGVALGLPVISFKDLEGFSFALGSNLSEKTSGCQLALLGFNQAQSMDGVQIALVNIQKEQHGDSTVQIGAYNHTGKNGVQIGLINNARDNATFQLGLINVNKNGLIPFTLVVNFGKHLFD